MYIVSAFTFTKEKQSTGTLNDLLHDHQMCSKIDRPKTILMNYITNLRKLKYGHVYVV